MIHPFPFVEIKELGNLRKWVDPCTELGNFETNRPPIKCLKQFEQAYITSCAEQNQTRVFL